MRLVVNHLLLVMLGGLFEAVGSSLYVCMNTYLHCMFGCIRRPIYEQWFSHSFWGYSLFSTCQQVVNLRC